MIDIRGTMKYDEVGKIFKIVGGCLVERYFWRLSITLEERWWVGIDGFCFLHQQISIVLQPSY